MSDLYNKIEALCKSKGVNVSIMCREANVVRGNLSDLKMGRTNSLSAKNLSKISSYFGVTMEYLLGTEKEKAPAKESERVIEDKDLKAAFFDGIDESLSEEQKEEYWDDARDYISFKIRQKQKKDGQSN